MTSRARPILLLALGNDILGDDGVAWTAARRLREGLDDHVDLLETGEAGLSLLDMMAGYERVLLLDSITTGRHPPGTVLEFSGEDFDEVVGPSPHCAGLPEVLELARRLDIDFPREIRILALEIAPPLEFRQTLSEEIHQALPAYTQQAEQILRRWGKELTDE